jgi:hypothetical protein
MEAIMAEDKQEEVERPKTLFDGPSTATWKLENEDFRRLARTGEFKPEAEKAEAK